MQLIINRTILSMFEAVGLTLLLASLCALRIVACMLGDSIAWAEHDKATKATRLIRNRIMIH